MRRNIILTVFKKELMDILRDKKTLFMTIVLPILLYPILTFLFTFLMSKASMGMMERNLIVAVSPGVDKVLQEMIQEEQEDKGKLEIIPLQNLTYKEALEKEEIAAYIEAQENEKIVAYNIYYNSSQEESSEACNRLEEILDRYKTQESKEKIKQLGLDEKEILEPITYITHNTADKEQVAGYMLGIILPMVLVISILTGCIYPATDAMAGEKERGTLETLLTLPISNMELIMGKYLAVALSALLSSIMTLLSMGFSMIFLLLNARELMGAVPGDIDGGKLALPIFMILVCILLFTLVIAAISMCVCSVAKSFKEAQNALTPLTVVAMVLSYASIIPNFKLDRVTASIPVVNVVLAIKSIFTFKYNYELLGIVVISNGIFALLSIWALSKLFKSEEVLFGGSRGFVFLEKRSDIKKGSLPGINEGIIVYSITMVLMLYLCSYLQIKWGMRGIALTQIIIIILPIILSLYIRSDFREVYALKRPAIRQVLGSILLCLGIWGFNILLQIGIQQYMHIDMSEAVAFQDELIKGGSGITSLFVIAFLPAVCEELLFRGFLFTAVKEKKHGVRAIIITAILFAIMHMSMIKMLPILCLGLGMGYILYRTSSIYCTMIMHLLNNGLAVVLTRYNAPQLERIETQLMRNQDGLAIKMVMIIILFIGIGTLLVEKGKLNKKLALK